jgi:hypothetical protein
MSTYWGFLRQRRARSTSRRTLVMGRFMLSIRGSALVGVMAIITAVLLVGVAIFILGHSEGDIVEYAVDDSRAFYIAEGGLERVRGFLTAWELDDPSANPVGTSFSGQGLGGGSYDAAVVADASGGGWPDAYDIVSTGVMDGVTRQVKATVVAETFAMYQWFIGSVGGGFSWFRSGERFEGPVHVNGTLGIDGDPWFGGLVRAGGGYTEKLGSNPTFVRGYELNVDQIDLPTRTYVLSTVRAQADAAGFRPGKLGPNKAYWVVELEGDSFSCEGFDKNGNPIGLGYTDVPLSSYNGAFWFDDDIRIQGTLDGALTIGVDGNIEIWGDILYADSSPGSGPNPGCDDILGLIATGSSEGNIIVAYTPDNQSDCEVHGVMMALQNTIMAEDYQHYPLRGDFIIYGGLIATKAIHLAEYSGDLIVSGYSRDYHYDSRVITLPPPFFPFASNFAVVTWEEVVPVVVES